MKRLRALEAENNKLKKPVAERDLHLDVMKEINRRKWLFRKRAQSSAGFTRA